MEKRPLTRILIVLLFAAVTTGCTSFTETKAEPVEEIAPGILRGYLPYEGIPNSLEFVPPPPTEGSAAIALDRELSEANLKLRGSARWELATEDANLLFPEAADAFSCALGVTITEEETPHLYMLLRRTIADAGLTSFMAKKHYQRPRPFMVNEEPICTPEKEEHLRNSGSYPSGHTAIGWAWALILSELAPERQSAILARGYAYGQSRVVCNVHWQSDVEVGRLAGAAAVARLHAEPKFKTELTAAKEEFAARTFKGAEVERDCSAEAKALGHKSPNTPAPDKE